DRRVQKVINIVDIASSWNGPIHDSSTNTWPAVTDDLLDRRMIEGAFQPDRYAERHHVLPERWICAGRRHGIGQIDQVVLPISHGHIRQRIRTALGWAVPVRQGGRVLTLDTGRTYYNAARGSVPV